MKITENNFLSQLRQKNAQAIEYIVEEYGSLRMSFDLHGGDADGRKSLGGCKGDLCGNRCIPGHGAEGRLCHSGQSDLAKERNYSDAGDRHRKRQEDNGKYIGDSKVCIADIWINGKKIGEDIESIGNSVFGGQEPNQKGMHYLGASISSYTFQIYDEA